MKKYICSFDFIASSKEKAGDIFYMEQLGTTDRKGNTLHFDIEKDKATARKQKKDTIKRIKNYDPAGKVTNEFESDINETEWEVR